MAPATDNTVEHERHIAANAPQELRSTSPLGESDSRQRHSITEAPQAGEVLQRGPRKKQPEKPPTAPSAPVVQGPGAPPPNNPPTSPGSAQDTPLETQEAVAMLFDRMRLPEHTDEEERDDSRAKRARLSKPSNKDNRHGKEDSLQPE